MANAIKNLNQLFTYEQIAQRINRLPGRQYKASYLRNLATTKTGRISDKLAAKLALAFTERELAGHRNGKLREACSFQPALKLYGT